MKKIFFLMIALVAVLFAGTLKAQTMHGIIVANIDDPSIGESCLKDSYTMEVEMMAIAAACGYEANVVTISGDDYSYSNVEKAVQRLKVGSNDMVFFYYTGHGGRAVDDKSRYPQMALGHTDREMMPLYKVDEWIASKSPKFRIVMADCCNSFVAGMSAKDLMLSEETRIKGSAEKNYKSLFGSVSGNVLVCSSSVGEPSAALTEGGAFTLSFLKELSSMVNGNTQPDWNRLMESTKSRTTRVGKHTPLYEVNVRNSSSPAPSYNGGGTVAPTTNNGDDFLAALMQLTSQNSNKMDRINRVDPLLARYFASPRARVEVYGRSFNTMVSRETSADFLARVATSTSLASFVVLSAEKDSNGKITYLKLHEIYKQN